MSYTIDMVPGFLLHDGVSWCRKNNRQQVRFIRTTDGIKEEVFATPAMLLAEIIRRQTEPRNSSIYCVSCGAQTDHRCYFVPQEFLCEPCYWTALKMIHDAANPPFSVNPIRGKVLEFPGVRDSRKEETQEEVAARLGVSLDVLRASGYFD